MSPNSGVVIQVSSKVAAARRKAGPPPSPARPPDGRQVSVWLRAGGSYLGDTSRATSLNDSWRWIAG